ncbi:MAG: Peptidase Imelysin [Acidimicrobiales bacterium]|nr:Peptidase Imelysin [Acidimicrobiales bacterium]
MHDRKETLVNNVHARSRRPRHRAIAGLLLVAGIGLLATSCAKSDDVPSAKGAIKVEITDAGCAPKPATAKSGEITFAITNNGSSKATEAELKTADGKNILGEKENITDGLSVSFKLNLREGKYKMFCPGAKQDTWDFTVSKGKAVKDWNDNPLLVTAVKRYSAYVDEQTVELAKATTTFTDAVRAGDIDKAKDTYALARVPYERIEPVAESFGALDPKIDGRADDGTEPTELTGFHRLEYALWVEKSLAGMGPVADQLDKDIVELQGLVGKKSGTYVPEEVTNGATELMNEVMVGKITGEEERYSHTDLLDVQANLDGSLKSIELVRPALEKSAPDLLEEIDGQAAKVQKALDAYKEDPGYAGTGFKEWGYAEDPASTITDAQRRALSDVVKPLTEYLSEVPVKVVV